MEGERHLAGLVLATEHRFIVVSARVVRGICPAIPQHDGATAVFARGDRSLEGVVVERVVLDLHRQPLDARIETRSLGHRPTLHHSIELEPKIEVEVARGMLLHHKLELLVVRLAAAWRLPGLRKIALPPVLLEIAF